MENIGERIRQARKKANMRQNQLADRLGIARATVTQWESGKAQPKGSRLPHVAKTLHVPTAWLLTGEGSEHFIQPKPEGLTFEELSMIEVFKQLSSDERKVIKSVADIIIKSK